MNKLKTIIDLVNQGDKAKLWKYLNKGIYSKKDKIDVVKSKGGGGNGGSEHNMEYISVESLNETGSTYMMMLIPQIAQYIKLKVELTGNKTAIFPAGFGLQVAANQGNIGGFIAFGIDFNAKVFVEGVGEVTALEAVLNPTYGITEEAIKSIPRMTEEEFYTL